MVSDYPSLFGKFILLKPLAQGGMGEITLALGGELGGFEKLCVIKRIRSSNQNESVVRRFLDEAKVVIKLSHGNVVQVFDAGYVDDELYLAMEYVEGCDLRTVLLESQKANTRVPLEVGLYIFMQICHGLDYAHTFGNLHLVHRDVCPSNVLVSYFGEVKVTDFGLAKSTIKEELTQPGKIFGKFSYLSPEQVLRKDVDARTDIYGASIILWELLTGKQLRPGPHHDPKVALQLIRQGHVPPPSTLNKAVSPALDAIVIKGLQVDPEHRFPSTEEMRRAIAPILARLDPAFSTKGVAAFMTSLFKEKIERTRKECETLLSRNYDHLRHANQPPASQLPAITPQSGSRPGEVEDLAGQIVDGRYRVIKQIGEGGMGAVYEVEHMEIGRLMAVKILHAIFSSHTETVARFRAEARAATRIGHPNIVEVTDSGTTEDGRVYFVMERLNGVDLAQVMADERIVPDLRALNITLQLCEALHAAHETGIVHRDLKPENIFLTRREGQNDFVKILDFGIAKHLELKSEDLRLTTPGIAMGTPEYMAPEQAAGENVDRRIDIYATGALLYEMLTGHLPHEGENLMKMLSLKASQPPTPPRRYRPDLPAGLEQVILKALAMNREQRFQTMLELARALRPFETEPGRPQRRSVALPLTDIPTASKDIPARQLADDLEDVPTTEQVRLASPKIDVRSGHPVLDLDSLGEHDGEPSPLRETTDPALLFSPFRGKVPSRALSTRTWMLIGAGLALTAGLVVGLVFWPGESPPAPPDGSAPKRPTADLSAASPQGVTPLSPKTPPPPTAPKTMTPKEIERLLEWTRRAADGGRYTRPKGDNVFDLLQRIVKDFPDHPGAQKLRKGVCKKLKRKAARLYRRRRYESAARLIRAWKRLDPQSEAPTIQLVLTQLALGRRALSKRHYRSALHFAKAAHKEMPDSPSATEFIGDIYARKKKFKSAIAQYEAALRSPKASVKQKRRLKKKLKRAHKRR